MEIRYFFQGLLFLNFSDFEPRIIRKLFLNTEGETWPKNLKNIFQSLLMFYCIVKLGKVLYLRMQKYI